MAANDYDIAVVGMACRFPGARNLDEFWTNLVNGVESITRLTDAEMLQAGVPPSHLNASSYVKAAPVLDAPGEFDAAFFGFSPMEAATLDPQHRLLLELAFEALEHAGIDPDRGSARVGVFAGSALNTYFTSTGLDRRIAEDYIPTLIGNDKDFLSTRVSYKLNLKGPSITVQTACSTSAVAIHLACQSLLSQESDVALAGAVSVRVPHRAGYFADGGGVVSPDGHVRAFDAAANGTVFGSGGGVLVLKRLADAVADRDTVHAVIKGSAVNNDGAGKAGYTAPSVDSQADAVIEALSNAGIDADDISYVEAHGSGTPVGDPIEVRALTKAFRTGSSRSGYCGLGSVKTNVGHLDAAAAVAGVIKTVLALEHRVIPASLHFSAPNPEIDFAATPFFVNTRSREWVSAGPRRAGVMSTGMGGTNAHLVLEEAPPASTPPDSGTSELLVLSAKTEAALDTAASQLSEYLSRAEVPLADIAHTLQVGRKAFAYRRTMVCRTREDAAAALRNGGPGHGSSGRIPDARRPLVLLLPGVGDHYVGMGHGLYESFPVFRESVDRCAEILGPLLGTDIRRVLYPAHQPWKSHDGGPAIDLRRMLGRTPSEDASPEQALLNETRVAQPALFTIEWATARLWQSLGADFDALAGHSLGEYVAACLAGVLSLEDALRLVTVRAQLVSALPPGAMLAVPLPEHEIAPQLPPDVSVSLINGPALCIVAGPPEAVSAFAAALSDRGVITRHVQNAHAFHSRMLEPVAADFEHAVQGVALHAPAVPYLSNVTGTWITAAEATSPAYWSRHLTQTARFNDGLRELWRLKNPLLLEAGPGRTLGVLAFQHPDRPGDDRSAAVSSLRHVYEHHDDRDIWLQAVGRLWTAGVDIAWEHLAPSTPRRRVPLPTYPFQRQLYWLDPVGAREPDERAAHVQKNPDQSKWLYFPTWSRLPRPTLDAAHAADVARSHRWLVFEDGRGVAAAAMAALRSANVRVITVRAGDRFERRNADGFILDPSRTAHYVSLMDALASERSIPDRIVHAWTMDAVDAFDPAQTPGFFSLVNLARALSAHHVNHRIDLTVLSAGVQDVLGSETLRPERATVLGPCMVIHQEHPHIHVRSIDVAMPGNSQGDTVQLLTDLVEPDDTLFVAYRQGQRWVQTYEPMSAAASASPAFRAGGVYAITGGLGEVGATVARHLAGTYGARLAFIGRTPLPPRDRWAELSQTASSDDPVRQRIAVMRAVESLGADTLYLSADVADAASMRAAVDAIYSRFGVLHGVIHAAGTVGDAAYCEIEHCTPERCADHFRAKALGVVALSTVLAGRNVDFCLLMSSLTSVLGGIGQAPYAAANVFMDVFARGRRGSATAWLSVNWDVWRLGGRESLGSGLGATLKDLGMTADEATATLERVVGLASASQIVVSTGDLQARIEQWVKLRSLDVETSSPPPTAIGRPPRAPRPALDRAYDAPRNDVERQIARVWQDALGLESVGVNDSFAQLGGHSLLAVRMVTELRRIFEIDLPVRVLFDAPTVAELARHITAAAAGTADSQPRAIVPLQARGTQVPIFGVPGHNGDVFCYRFLAERLGPDQPVFGLEPPGLDGQSVPVTRIEDLAAYFADQIRAFRPDGPYVIAGFCAGGVTAFELAQQLRRSGADVRMLAMFGAPFPDIYRPAELQRYLRRERLHARVDWMLAHLRSVASSPSSLGSHIRTTLLNRRERMNANTRAAADPVLSMRAAVERATLEAAGRYSPEPYTGTVALFVPGKPWAEQSGMAPLRWQTVAPAAAVYFGPEDSNSDIMFLEPHVSTFADALRRALSGAAPLVGSEH